MCHHFASLNYSCYEAATNDVPLRGRTKNGGTKLDGQFREQELPPTKLFLQLNTLAREISFREEQAVVGPFLRPCL